ncbi:class I SAM-dependent methyltransferase [Pseudomonadales bacterium]|nr:class I SAM-dependent methyltransferase [Pseudomonadales bacterium]
MLKQKFKSLMKRIKHQHLSRYLVSKGYVVDKVAITDEEVASDIKAVDGNAVNVLIKDWLFSKADHCYLEEISDENSNKYEINDLCSLCNVKMAVMTEVYGASGRLGLQTSKCPSCDYIRHTRNFNQEWYAAHFRDKWLLCDGERENSVSAKNLPYDEVFHLLQPNADIADIGCGIGDRLKKFKDNGMAVDGCDPSEHRTRVASGFLESEIRAMGGEEFFELNTKKFDLVYFYTSLHFTENPFHLIKEAARSLKENGYIYIVDSKYNYHNLFHAAHLGVARSFMSLKSLDILATELGLKIIKYEAEPFQVMLSSKRSDTKCNLHGYLDVDKFINSELYPKQHKDNWVKVNYQPFGREIKFHIVDNDSRSELKKKRVKYPVKFISCDYQNPPLMLK